MAEHDLAHFRIEQFKSEHDYSPPSIDLSGKSSGRDRKIHGPALQSELAAAFAAAHAVLTARDSEARTESAGVYLEVESAIGDRLPDLNWPSQHIRLGALRVNEEGSQLGALFVPASAEHFLAAKVTEYTRESTAKGKPRHEDRFAPLEAIRAGTVDSLWTDNRPMTSDIAERFWWECWCVRNLSADLVHAADRMRLRVSDRRLYFPESAVIPVYANRDEMTQLLQRTDAIEELRQATDTPAFFTVTARKEQHLWIEDLVSRVDAPPEIAPAVCILDSGVSAAHPLLTQALDTADCLSVDKSWGVDDHEKSGHGTNMAGSVLYGDLTYPLADAGRVSLEFRLESVKFLSPPGLPETDPMSYGAITQSAVSEAEIKNPKRQRVVCMAVTNLDVSGERPSSWSSAIDQCCAGVMNGDEQNEHGEPPRRLMFVSAGNVPDSSDPEEISDLEEFPVEDPAQAWNAVCVGGFTDKAEIAPEDKLPGWHAVAGVGDHSPYSRISVDWDHSLTPIKPEIVFEAGNRAVSENQLEILAGVDSLSLLTTGKDFLQEPLVTFWATSPATAQAARMAAQIMARHPDLWPETVRALMVHSAEWTPAMLKRFDDCGSKADRISLARNFGYGVPRLDRAVASARNDLALIAQTYIKPYKRERRLDSKGHSTPGEPTFDDVHYYELPWPRRTLEELEGTNVRLKVTLSYFIEPSPGRSAPVTPALYQSFGLRFDLKRKRETRELFHKRVNRLERDAAKLPTADPDSGWTFGSKSVAAGSMHCDVWEGPAVDLAARDLIAIYPVGGWWRYRTHLKRYDSQARYALIISITADGEDSNLYEEIQNQIAVAVETKIAT
jgi:hypothetical protein